MTWDYRIVVDRAGTYSIHEAYYRKDKVWGVTAQPVPPLGDSMDELKEDLRMMAKAFRKPVLSMGDYDSQDEGSTDGRNGKDRAGGLDRQAERD